MINREQWRAFVDHPVTEWAIFVVGVVLIILSPVAGVIPGPGGVVVFAIGLAMVLKTSLWAKRRYARFKRWSFKVPRLKIRGRTVVRGGIVAPGRFTDWVLRRRSAIRREQIRREREEFERSQQTIAGD